MFEKVLKQHLDDIVDNLNIEDEEAYKLRIKFKNYNLVLSSDIRKSYSGLYDPRTRTITITITPAHTNANQVCTALHELAHHCDSIYRGATDHSKEFYRWYALLIYSALDLGKINYTDALNIVHVNSDYNKVIKILRNYIPRLPQDKEPEELLNIILKDVPKGDTRIKNYGYTYNQRGDYWFRSIRPEVSEYELSMLDDLGYVNHTLTDANLITILDDDQESLRKAALVDSIISKAIKEWDYLDEYIKRKAGTGSSLEDIRRSLDGNDIVRESNVEEYFQYDYITIAGKIRKKSTTTSSFISLDPYVDIYENSDGTRILFQRDINIAKLKSETMETTKKVNI